MTSQIKILIASDVSYDYLIAEIYVDGKFIGLVSQENGTENLMFEFPGTDQNESAIVRHIKYEVLLEALAKAKSELLGV